MRVSCFLTISFLAMTVFAGPVLDPIPNANIPAGKSLTLPVTASSPEGRPLTYTVTSSTNRITVEVHTNNPFWKMSVAQVAPPGSPGAYPTTFRGSSVLVTNVGDLEFMLFKDRAPRTVDAFVGFSHAGFYSSNTIFHRVIPGFMIQGGDPATNGTGGPVFRFDDEFHPRSFFTGHGQLAMANSGKDSNGSQFFVTLGSPRHLDFNHTILGQLLRGFAVQTNIVNTPRNASDRPLRDVIIQRASIVTNTTDTVITLTGTNQAGVSGTIQVVADDGAGGRTTNTFTALTVSDAANNAPPFLYPNTVTNLVAPINGRLTNHFTAQDVEGNVYFWFPRFADQASFNSATNSSYSILPNGLLQLVLVPNSNYTGVIHFYGIVSSSSLWNAFPDAFPYDRQLFTFAFGDTKISALPAGFVTHAGQAFSNELVATFTNILPASAPNHFTATINWGDNSINAGTIVTNAAGHKEVRGSHTYTHSGHYPVQITIRSALGAQAVVASTALVPPALSYTRWGNTNRLQWPSWAADYQIQSHTNLATPHWLTLSNPPALNGYDQVLTHTNAASREFFRLKK